MALPLTTTIPHFLAPSTADSSRASSPMEDDEDNPFHMAIDILSYDITRVCDDVDHSKATLRNFLTKHTPRFPQGLPHALGLHLTDEPLGQVLTAQAELIKALTAEAIVYVTSTSSVIVRSLLLPRPVALEERPVERYKAPPATPTKQPSAQSPPKLPTAPPPTPPKATALAKAPPKPSAQAPSFASAVKVPTRPSLVLTPAPSTGPSPSLAVHKTPSEICACLNSVLSRLHLGSSLSAARWMKNNNLVIVAGPDTTAHHLQQAAASLTTSLSLFISTDPSTPIPITAKENVCWSRILINNIPTGASPSRGAHSPSECHDTLSRENPAYRALRLTRPPSWVRKLDSYLARSSSSLVLSFEDPLGDALRSLLQQKRLYTFGSAGELHPWKQKPRAKASPPTA
ncbi:hypothetical protein EDB83DRAFT_2520604 [Lactarius deliciosus]|nr:hypothetical protein EDB83DRAFT_2520604 [Lactarius deliciosus]